jgi:hypothetical protein
MKKALVFLVLLSCSSFEKKLPTNIDNNVKTAENLLSQGAIKIWPSFKDFTPLVFINHFDSQFLLNSSCYPKNGYNYYNNSIRHPLGEKIGKRPYHSAFLSKMHKGLELSLETEGKPNRKRFVP